MGRIGLFVVVLLASVAVGCSFGMQTVPTDHEPSKPPQCSTSGAPVVDLGAGALFAGVGVASSQSEEEGQLGDGLGAVMIVAGLVYLAASLYGFSSRSSCAKAHAAHDAQLSSNKTVR